MIAPSAESLKVQEVAAQPSPATRDRTIHALVEDAFLQTIPGLQGAKLGGLENGRGVATAVWFGMLCDGYAPASEYALHAVQVPQPEFRVSIAASAKMAPETRNANGMNTRSQVPSPFPPVRRPRPRPAARTAPRSMDDP